MRPRCLALVLGSSLLLGACAARVAAPAASHPASPEAEPGRLGGAPPSLRAGAVSYPDVPVGEPAAPPSHQGHHHHAP